MKPSFTDPPNIAARKAERREAWGTEHPRHAWALNHLEGPTFKERFVAAIEGDLVPEEQMEALALIADALEAGLRDAGRRFTLGLAGRCSICARRMTYFLENMELDDGHCVRVGGSCLDVTWQCSVCDEHVCRWCAMVEPAQRMVILSPTYCSETCWKKDGSPDE